MGFRFHRTASLLLVALHVVACGPTPWAPSGADWLGEDGGAGEGAAPGLGLPGSAGQEASSGARLKAAWVAGDDGSRQFRGWYDTQLDTFCAFEDVEGDATGPQCIPEDILSATTEAFDSWSGAALFTDPSCSAESRVLYIPSHSDCVEYGVLRIDDDLRDYLGSLPQCGLYQKLNEITYYTIDAIDPSTTTLYEYGVPDGGGTCCGCYPIDSSEIDDNLVVVRVGDKLDRANTPFATSSVTVDP